MKEMKFTLPFLFLFFFRSDLLVETPSLFVQPAEAEGTHNVFELNDLVLQRFREARYREAALLLQTMKEQYPDHYERFPYILLHAKAFFLSAMLTESNALYSKAARDFRYAPFTYLPQARIAVMQGRVSDAIAYYGKSLSSAGHPDFVSIAREALDYCVKQNRPKELMELAQFLGKKKSLQRLSQFYIARSYDLRGDRNEAKRRYLQLIHSWERDDVTSFALRQLDTLDSNQLSYAEQAARGRMAYTVWDFDLVRKYLAPIAFEDIKNAYYYGRALAFLGDWEGAQKIYQRAIDTWPDHSLTKRIFYHYAGACLRQGDPQRAEQLYRRLIGSSSRVFNGTTYKWIQAMRAQGKLNEAIASVTPYCRVSHRIDGQQALFLRARIYHQLGRYREAFVDLDSILKNKNVPNRREITLWKGIVLQKMKQNKQAIAVYQSLLYGDDFFSLKAKEKLQALGVNVSDAGSLNNRVALSLPVLPGYAKEEEIYARLQAGDFLPAFLYLNLFEEAAPLLDAIQPATWALLEVDPANHHHRQLAVSYLSGLSGNFSTAVYLSEIVLKNFAANMTSFSRDVLRALFPFPYSDPIAKFSLERDLDPFLIVSIMKQESKFKKWARSQSFARGLMQLIPSTAVRIAGEAGLKDFSMELLYEPEININLGTKYLQQLVKKFGNNVELIAAAYNGGEENVRRWLACSSTDELMDFFSNIDLPETKKYVMIVKTNYEYYRRIYSSEFPLSTQTSTKGSSDNEVSSNRNTSWRHCCWP